jgi:regulatory protein YycI of two-component signal transduction system YycFG
MELPSERDKLISFLKKDNKIVKYKPGTLQKNRTRSKLLIDKPAVETTRTLNTKPETVIEGYSFWL